MPGGERVGILGGSFNPVHNGHVRLAIEALERLRLDRVEFVPCGHPPHKPCGELLPFALRVSLLEVALEGLRQAWDAKEGQGLRDTDGLPTPRAGQDASRDALGTGDTPVPRNGFDRHDNRRAMGDVFRVNPLEAARPGPSYTWDTLTALRAAAPDTEFHFILGASDLLTLPQWRRGLELHHLAHLVIAPRAEDGLTAVTAFFAAHWPEAILAPAPREADALRVWRFPTGQTVTYLPQPLLEISASLLRDRWRQGRRLSGLTPAAVARELLMRRGEVEGVWGRRAEPQAYAPRHEH